MRRTILLVTAMAAALVLAGGVAYAVTKTCETVCKGTDNRDVLIGTSADTSFYGFKKGDQITDTAKHDNDLVKAGSGNDVINVREGGNAQNEADVVDCGEGYDTVYADANDRVNEENCEVVYRS